MTPAPQPPPADLAEAVHKVLRDEVLTSLAPLLRRLVAEVLAEQANRPHTDAPGD